VSTPPDLPTGLTGSPYILTAGVLLVRELVAVIVHLSRRRTDREIETAGQVKAERAAVAAETDAAYRRLGDFVDKLQSDLESLRGELEQERTARRRAENSWDELRQEMIELRLALQRGGCRVLDCLKGGQCDRRSEAPAAG